MGALVEQAVTIRRAWAMPSPETFSIRPIQEWIAEHTKGCATIVDPFARDSKIGTHTNDLARGGVDAEEYCLSLRETHGDGWADALLFDPPYSPRQIAEVYKSVGLAVGVKETQNAALYKRVRDAMWPLLKPGGVALSFGWNSAGFGKSRGAQLFDVLLVAHGGAHNDTICTADRKAVEPEGGR